MSTLSKIFVVMVMVLALVLLGVNATNFAMRADFKHKWMEETRYHFQTQQIKASEIADLGNRNTLLTEFNGQLKSQNEALVTEIGSVKSQLSEKDKELIAKQTLLDKFAVDFGTMTRNYEVQNQSLADKEAKLAETARNLAKALNERFTATNDLQYSRQEAERLVKDLGALENQYQDMARDRQRLQETIANLSARGVSIDGVPRKPIEGQVNAVATDLDLVVISIGRDAGVNEGDEFTVYRGNTFVCKITVNRVDRLWASGRVTLKGKEEPRIGDQASNNVLASPGRATNN